jgi:3-deoxy-D-manno-octulosonic-acid transferase
LLLILLLRYLLRMKKRGGYRDGFLTRLGIINGLPPKKAGVRRVWIQAVSVGEILGVVPILRALATRPDYEVFLTTTTSTGYALARERYRDQLIGLAYFPLDFWPFSRRAWNRVQPDLCLLMESELWPEHLHQAAARRVPLLLINGRISDRSFGRLSALAFLTPRLLGKFSRILAASEDDAKRFNELGATAGTVTVSGNIKLDVNLEPILNDARKDSLLRELGLSETAKDSPPPILLLGSSTWPGEEETLLRTLGRAREEGLNCRLLLVPRHMERRTEVRRTLEGFPFSFHFRSQGAASDVVDVAVADTTGELLRLTQLADLVFVGKSLPPNHGGQTPIEAAAFGKPLLYGPYMTNFRLIARQLVDAGAAVVVGDETDLIEQALPLLSRPEERARMAARAREWHAANRGAVRKTLDTIEEMAARNRAAHT